MFPKHVFFSCLFNKFSKEEPKQKTIMKLFVSEKGAGSIDMFQYQRCGLQGGVNTPHEFNTVLQYLLEDIIEI